MLALIAQSSRPYTAMELYEKMEQSISGLSYGTVYRNIKLFLRLHFIESTLLGDEVRYRAVEYKQPQFQFICMDCQKTIEVAFDPAGMAFPMPERFQSVNYKLDIFGYCTNCS